MKVLLFALAAAVQASAQPPALAGCDLHLYAMKLGAPANFKGNMFVKPLPASTDPLAFINVVSPFERMNDLTDDDYRQALSLAPTARIVRHWDVPIDKNSRKTVVPLSPIGTGCQAELIGYDSVAMAYKRSRLGKDEVVISFLYREFGSAGQVAFKYDGAGYAAINAIERTARTDREAARSDLTKGSEEILADFGKALAKQRAKVFAKN